MQSICDEPFLTLKQAAEHLRLSVLQVRRAVAFDPETGQPGEGSSFPNAYKATPGLTATIRIPESDIYAFKAEQAGLRQDGSFIYDEPYLPVREAAKHLRLSVTQMRTFMMFKPEDKRPQEGSAFPHAYKETPGVTSPVRVPTRDIEDYKARQTGGRDEPAARNGVNIPAKQAKQTAAV